MPPGRGRVSRPASSPTPSKGKGVSFMEGDFNWHAKVPTDEQLAQALAELDAQLAAIGDETREAA